MTSDSLLKNELKLFRNSLKLGFETLSSTHNFVCSGFHRKAGFCQRLAATRHVSPNNPSPDWQKCYYLMLHSFPGYKLSLDPNYVIQYQVGEFLF